MESNIIKALVAFNADKPKIIKNLTNPYYKSLYADINQVLYTVEPLLKDQGILILQCCVAIEGKRYLETRLIHAESGESVNSYIELVLPAADMQKMGGAITYARRYALVTMLNLEQEDDDGNLASTLNGTETKVPELATKKQVDLLKKLMTEKKLNISEFLKKYNYTRLEDLDKKFASEKINKLMGAK